MERSNGLKYAKKRASLLAALVLGGASVTSNPSLVHAAVIDVSTVGTSTIVERATIKMETRSLNSDYALVLSNYALVSLKTVAN